MNSGQHIPLVEVTRGNIVESVHYGSLVIAQPDGKIVFSLGDITSPTYLRSASKPMQTLAFLEQGGAEHYNLTEQEIAIMCASHSGTDDHLEVLAKLQEKIGITESMLQCGAHAPYHEPSAQALRDRGEAFHSNHSDCSGKHSGMLAFAKMMGVSYEGYISPDHPVQQAMLNTFAEMCEYNIEKIELGTDGCSVPVFAVPLINSAGAYARLCQPDNLSKKRPQACQMIVLSMMNHANMVGGPLRFDTDAMVAGEGSFVTKVGAEGFRGIGILPGKAAGFETSLGITIKISDGDLTMRATSIVALSILKHLGVLNSEQAKSVKKYDRRPVTNWSGKTVGEIRPSAELVEALAKLQV